MITTVSLETLRATKELTTMCEALDYLDSTTESMAVKYAVGKIAECVRKEVGQLVENIAYEDLAKSLLDLYYVECLTPAQISHMTMIPLKLVEDILKQFAGIDDDN